MLKRRLISIPLVLLGTDLLLVLFVPLFVLAWIITRLTRYRGLDRTLCFLTCLAVLEVLGLVWLLANAVYYRQRPGRMAADYKVQFWWAGRLLASGQLCYGITFEVLGTEAIDGPSAILISRHASIGDNVLPLLFFAKARGQTIRYMLKKELTWLPTLDLGGHSLPNLFLDRSGENTDRELAAVEALTRGAGPEESVLIYPEGTRYTRKKQTQLARRPHLQAQIERWPNLLPPRLGGVMRMLAVNPGKDVVFLCHSGFDGSASLTDLIHGNWINQRVRLQFWRIPYADIPADHEAFLFDQWDRMQATLLSLQAGDR